MKMKFTSLRPSRLWGALQWHIENWDAYKNPRTLNRKYKNTKLFHLIDISLFVSLLAGDFVYFYFLKGPMLSPSEGDPTESEKKSFWDSKDKFNLSPFHSVPILYIDNIDHNNNRTMPGHNHESVSEGIKVSLGHLIRLSHCFSKVLCAVKNQIFPQTQQLCFLCWYIKQTNKQTNGHRP